jgi:hypothetical protein
MTGAAVIHIRSDRAEPIEASDVHGEPSERQTELVPEQMKLCLETAGSSLHFGGELHCGECGLCAPLPDGAAGTHLRLRAWHGRARSTSK